MKANFWIEQPVINGFQVFDPRDRLKVTPWEARQTLVEWHNLFDINKDTIFYVQKSNSPTKNWLTIAHTTPFDLLSYLDDEGNNTFANHSTEYYRLVVMGPGSNYIVGPLTVNGVADAYGSEISRRHRIKLDRGLSGNLMYLFTRIKYGDRCPECWDEILQKRVSVDCAYCLGTGFFNGYCNPYPIYVSMGVEREFIDHETDGPVNKAGQTDAWTSNYPILNNGDMLIEPNSRRLWSIDQRQFSTHKRVVTKQNLVLTRVTGDDPTWRLVERLPQGS